MSNQDKNVEHSQNEISLVDFLLIFARQKKVIFKSILYFTIMGLIIAIFVQNFYTSSIDIIPETNSSGNKYLRALSVFGSFGSNLNDPGSNELSIEAYPRILRSQYVLFQLLADSFAVYPLEKKISVQDYLLSSNDWRSIVYEYSIGLPGKIIKLFSTRKIAETNPGPIITLTSDEEDALKLLNEMIEVEIDYDANLMRVLVSSKDPVISKILANNLLDHFKNRVRSIHTEKSRENVLFLQQHLKESKKDLERSETELARFVDENLSLQSATSKIEIERRQRLVNFNVEVYSELQKQLTSAEIEHQRSIPVLSIIDNPVPSNLPSGPGRKKIVLLVILAGFFIGMVLAFIKGSIAQYNPESLAQKKLDELKSLFTLKSFLEDIKSTFK